jgi:pyruvate/2-oxoglutarate dehydrogenase complex dihydrolipoamide dehydrogenase (E3) component
VGVDLCRPAGRALVRLVVAPFAGPNERTTVTDAAGTDNHFDLIVIGGGPGRVRRGALRGVGRPPNVAVVEKDKVGGTCLHRGCIPAKELLETAHVFRTSATPPTSASRPSAHDLRSVHHHGPQAEDRRRHRSRACRAAS